jgi:tetratricopeptide (TPR) repeat protein
MSETAEQLSLQAPRLLREGRVGEAIDAYERLLALRPDVADSWYNLAYLQRCDRRFESALHSYQRALDHGVGRPEEVHVNRAAILSEHLERGEAAEKELKNAIELNPGFALAWLNLGNLYEDWGDPDRARAAYEKVLEIIPSNGRALARVAGIEIFEGNAERALPRLREALQSPEISTEDLAEIAFALGNALDATRAYDQAFATFEGANRASRASAPPGIRYDPSAHEKLIDELISAFPRPAAKADKAQEKPPVFICGMFRSGSTLAEQILARHSRVTPGGELEFLPALVQAHLQPYPRALASVSPETIDRIRTAYLDSLKAIHPAADIATDKRPDNFMHIGLIKTLFPDARIVHTKREPLDNILSIYFLHFDQSVSYGHDLRDIAHWYRQYLKLMDHWKSLYPDDIFDFDYDEAVANPRPAIESLLQFCGLEREESCLAMHPARNTVRTASVWQVRQPLHSRSSGRWRNYEAHLNDVRAALEGSVTG